MSSEDSQELLNKAYFFLKFRPRTKKEMRDYLYKKILNRHFSRDDADKVIFQLEERKLIDDKAFVDWFIDQRSRTKQKGELVLKGEMLRLGITKELIDQKLEEKPLEEEDLAFKALSSKWHRFKNLPDKERFAKSAAFLSRRGFSFDIIKKIVNHIEDNN